MSQGSTLTLFSAWDYVLCVSIGLIKQKAREVSAETFIQYRVWEASQEDFQKFFVQVQLFAMQPEGDSSFIKRTLNHH